MSDRIKIFFCEQLDVGLCENIYECGKCEHWTRVTLPERMTHDEWSALPFGGSHLCEKCGNPAGMVSRGLCWFYRRTDTGEEIGGGRRALPPGAVWATDHGPRGPDGRSLYCMTPGGEWCIDGRAKNCTLPDDDEHRCWVRTGRPEDGTLDVGKSAPGQRTCSAGAGSIGQPGYHGFLRHGYLVRA